MLTVQQFTNVFPRAKEPQRWVNELSRILPFRGINTKQRQAAFLAQTGHESAGYSVLTENLNYSAIALNAVFPKYFKNAGRDANAYARQPEKIANVVYANRMGNGNTESGDGWKYRGRGLIQLTGKSNYQRFADYIGDQSIVQNPDVVSQVQYAIESAVWFWNANSLNTYADSKDIKTMTKRINGGFNGLDERERLFRRILSLMG